MLGLTVAAKVIASPKHIFDLLGSSLPKMCGFFSCYIIIKALAGLPMELARIVALMVHATKRLARPSGTPRDREGDWIGMRDFHNPGWFAYARYAPQDLLVVLIVMSYACMAPLILLPGMLFFGVASVVYRHQFLFVYIEDHESGGLFWPKIYRRIIFSLFVAQATMVGMFVLKSAYMQVYSTLLLMALTYLYKAHMRSKYLSSSSATSSAPGW